MSELTTFRSKPYYHYLAGRQWHPGANIPGVEESPLGCVTCPSTGQQVFDGDWVMESASKFGTKEFEVYRKDVIDNGFERMEAAQ